jgi:hypothetical protein
VTEFDLFIDSEANDVALLSVSPNGVARARVPSPSGQPAFDALRVRVSSRESGVSLREQFGKQLFDAVFREDILSAWSKATVDPEGVRLRLIVGAGPLASLPWELLFDGRNFMATDAALAISRYIPVPEPPGAPVVDTLRILLAIANPGPPLPAIPVDEMDGLAASIGDAATVTQLRGCTLQSLSDAIAADDYHVVHYLGHGATGSLLLEKAAPPGFDPMSARAFAQLLFGRPSIRLVVLSACSSAQPADDGVFSGVGQALIRARVPAVVAMQYDFVQLSTAQAFNRRFYKEIAAGTAVDLAVNRARNAISATGDLLAQRDWSTPVLYVGTRNGRLITLEREQTSEVEKAAQSVEKAAMQSPAAAEGWQSLLSTFGSLRASHLRLAAVTSLHDQLAQLRIDFDAIVATANQGIGGAQFQSIRTDWSRLNGGIIPRLKAAVAAAPDADVRATLRPVVDGFAPVDDAVARIALGDLETAIGRLRQVLADADAGLGGLTGSTLAALLATSERTLGKLTPQD